MMDFHTKRLGENQDIVCLVLSGEMDEVGCNYLLDCVEGQIEDGCEKMILDCAELSYISSVGLGMLMRVHSKMKKKGGDVRLAALQGMVGKLVSLVKLDRILNTYPTVDEAAAALETH